MLPVWMRLAVPTDTSTASAAPGRSDRGCRAVAPRPSTSTSATENAATATAPSSAGNASPPCTSHRARSGKQTSRQTVERPRRPAGGSQQSALKKNGPSPDRARLNWKVRRGRQFLTKRRPSEPRSATNTSNYGAWHGGAADLPGDRADHRPHPPPLGGPGLVRCPGEVSAVRMRWGAGRPLRPGGRADNVLRGAAGRGRDRAQRAACPIS